MQLATIASPKLVSICQHFCSHTLVRLPTGVALSLPTKLPTHLLPPSKRQGAGPRRVGEVQHELERRSVCRGAGRRRQAVAR